MKIVADPIDRQLLDNWQRDFPITPEPFVKLADALDIEESDVLERLTRMRKSGRITRVGATIAPNTVSASTLAAIAAPADRIDEVAAIIGSEQGVNHSYEREDHWNLWFVVTGPNRGFVNAAIKRIEQRTGLQVMDLRLQRPFNVDLGFRLNGGDAPGIPPVPRPANTDVLMAGDTDLLQALTKGMPMVSRPYEALGTQLGLEEAGIRDRITALSDAGIISRLGVIVRHRALGWRSNAMVVWDIPSDQITKAGPVLAAQPGITLCYERTPVEGHWPYRLYSMIHARSRLEALKHLANAASLPELKDVPHKALFSTRCFKQTGALVAAKPEVAA
ncbi:transcriptional regulator, AsnC family [Shimia gijangensis]|uniref:siroheme decarboxylase n=1 Tax=Shimia gijangensis TaxID=1470563 RepID=A0A1M6LTN2_9RHOB|nr:AsnC family transcriptional regulator [Shimia gijangensis]SHJ74607.1 transcriptional regulator, AsnC family [Shimia gijangensis]